MSALFDALDDHYNSTIGQDSTLTYATAIVAEFKSQTVRLWGGLDKLYTTDGQEFLGWYGRRDGKTESYLTVPSINDLRSGTSPKYEFVLGYIDEDHYRALRDEAEEVKDELLTIYDQYLEDPEVTRATIPLGNPTRLRMKSVKFTERRIKNKDGSHKKLMKVTLLAVNANEGRSSVNFGAMNSVGQRTRSEILYGINNDQYGQFTALLAGGIKIILK